MKFKMPAKKSSPINPVSQNLFQDRYGVLALAAHATLKRTSSVSKVGNDSCPRFMRWVNSVLVIIKQLLQHNSISFSDCVWMESDTLMYHILSEEYLQKERK